MLKIRTIILYITFLFLSACCSEDKICSEAQLGDFSPLPYSTSEKIVYKDSLGKSITIQFDSIIKRSAGWQNEGNCNAFKKDGICPKTISLVSKVVTDSSGLILGNNKWMSIMLIKSDELSYNKNAQKYYLNAFGAEIIAVSDYENTSSWNAKFSPYVKLDFYKTPFDTYNNVFVKYPDTTLNKVDRNQDKYVFDSNGCLISFSLNKDTLHLFHISK
jgi:hypothetical protein